MQAKLSLFIGLAILAISHAEFKLTTENMTELKGTKEVKDFKQSSHVRVIYFYRRDIPRLKSYLKELQKSAEFLALYQVKMGFCDCTLRWNSDVKECGQKDIENNIYTYRSGSSLLSLELQTMFDVNSIMSNILQLVLLREVPILQTPEELKKYLKKHRGGKDIIFGHMKAIGTFDHRVFMEVAYAYSDKLKFAVSTDKKTTSMFSDQPVTTFRGSSIWYVWTKVMGKDDTHYHGTLYKGEINLASLARFAKMLTLPKMFDIPANGITSPYTDLDVDKVRVYYRAANRFDIPADGLTSPYTDLDVDTVRVYYRAANRATAYQNGHLISRHFAGTVGIHLIDVDQKEEHGIRNYDGPGPALSFVKKGQDSEQFLTGPFETHSIAEFIMNHLDVPVGQTESPPGGDDDDIHSEDPVGPGPGDNVEIGPGGPDENSEMVETQDDMVAEAVNNAARIPMLLSHVPALTDKTFPQMLDSNRVAAILFYFPFDAISMANLRMFGEAADRIVEDTSLMIGRVNCYDWTDVCQAQNISMYPTLRVFEGGKKVWDYRGPQDTQAFYTTLRILEMSPPVQLKTSAEVMTYLDGQDKMITDLSNTTVLGLFGENHKKELAAFQQVAREARKDSRILYAYTDIAEAKKIASQFDADLPAVILSKFDDSIDPHIKYMGKFTPEILEHFVDDNKLPKLTTLTPLMFPELRRRGSNFLILFSDGSVPCQEPEEAVREIIKANVYNNVSFTVMPVSSYSSIGFKVLREYTPDPQIPYISYVNLHKGSVFNFDMSQFDKEGLSQWIGAVEDGSLEPSTVLSEGEWKPVNKGYDFLRMILWQKEEEARKRKKGALAGGEVGEQGEKRDEEEFDEMMLGEARGDVMEDSEDSEVRKDLHDLSKSRLYNMGAGRGAMGAGPQGGARQHEMEDMGEGGKPAGHDEL